MKYRIGLDMGATSIGWSIFDVENQNLVDFGVRIFDDGREDKSKASLCVKRRNARGARRLNNRRHIKTNELLKTLTALNLFPTEKLEKEDLKKQNPYLLRKAGLDKQLTPFELGRVFLQLGKRKGFKSNRKDNKEEGGKLKIGYQELLTVIAEKRARTYGEYLSMQLKDHKAVRLKNLFDDNGKYKGGLFPFREIYEQEFDKIWQKQKTFYPEILNEENYRKIKGIIFFQRPLKEVEEGECQFEKGEKRIPRAHPLFQEFRIWQNILNLSFCGESDDSYHSLSKEENNKLAELLQNPLPLKPNAKGVVIYANIKKALGLDKNGVFNFERGGRPGAELEKGLLVDTTQLSMDKSKYMAEFWQKMNIEQRGKLINVLSRPKHYINYPLGKISIDDENNLIIGYLCQEFDLSEDAAKELLYDISMEDDYSSLSEKAISKILYLMKNGIAYTDAWRELYPSADKQHLDFLPYYGEILTQNCVGKREHPQTVEEEYGKINNATVHVALNQVRYLINEIIETYGKPYDIAVEYARDLPASAKDRLKMSSTRDANEQENQKIEKEMRSKIADRNYTKRDIQKYKIWKSLGSTAGNPLVKECPFTGKPISIEDLMNGQKVQIEHLIPFSRSLDDSLNNKVLAYVDANRYKGNRTPFEAFGESKDGYNWQEIKQRAKKLRAEQQWRFAPDAMKKFEEQVGPIARSLNDTRYMTRLLHDYLQPIVCEDGKQNVQAVVGALTSMVRKAWGLDLYKNKEDDEGYRAFHNHHAIDAIIVSVIERSQIASVGKILQKVSKSVIEEFRDEFPKLRDDNVSDDEKKALKKRIKDFEQSRTLALINEHFKIPATMRVEDILNRVNDINISHKPNLKNIKTPYSTVGQLHEDSAYGLQKFISEEGLKAIFKFGKKEMEKEVTEYIPMFYDKTDKKEYYDAYKEWFILDKKSSTMNAETKEQKQRKKEIAEKETKAIVRLREASQKAFKWFVGGGNYCADVYQINPENKICNVPTKNRGEWKIEVVSNYNATIRQDRGENIGYWYYKYPNAKKIMSLRRNDMVMATFTKEQAYNEKFPKGICEYVRNKFDKNPLLKQVDVLFRVKKMVSGVITFTPHDIAKEEADTKSWSASAGSMQNYRTRKVKVTPMGRICHVK